MRDSRSLSRRPCQQGSVGRGVFLGVIGITGAFLLFMALITGACRRDGPHDLMSCISNLRMMGQAMAYYYNEYDSWMVCGGNRAGEHDEPPFTPPGSTDPDFPYWYEALTPYINPAATHANARKSYVQREGKEPSREQVAQEAARLCMLYSCDAKKQAVIGYGYNYAAPYGVDAIYQEKPGLAKLWDKPGPVPVLWYGQSVPFGVLKEPTNQISVCDAGLVTNDAELKTAPEYWLESKASNVTGYVRFPLCDAYKQSARYRSEKAWRPVPRHNKRAACLYFDGRATPVNIRDIVDHSWGDRECLFDNVPSP